MFSPEVIQSVLSHATACIPREACGLVIETATGQEYRPCTNIAEASDQFILDPDEYADIEDYYKILGIAHSHYGAPPSPSQADLVGCESSALPWLIVSVPTGTHQIVTPTGYVAPLLGRQFYCGVLDCYSIVRDYHQLELGIHVKDYERSSDWWLKGKNHFMDRFEDAGFVQKPLAELQKHDVVLMKCNSAVPNHAAIYLGNNIILHHLVDRLSSKDVYGGYWLKATVCVLRHKELG